MTTWEDELHDTTKIKTTPDKRYRIEHLTDAGIIKGDQIADSCDMETIAAINSFFNYQSLAAGTAIASDDPTTVVSDDKALKVTLPAIANRNVYLEHRYVDNGNHIGGWGDCKASIYVYFDDYVRTAGVNTRFGISLAPVGGIATGSRYDFFIVYQSDVSANFEVFPGEGEPQTDSGIIAPTTTCWVKLTIEKRDNIIYYSVDTGLAAEEVSDITPACENMLGCVSTNIRNFDVNGTGGDIFYDLCEIRTHLEQNDDYDNYPNNQQEFDTVNIVPATLDSWQSITLDKESETLASEKFISCSVYGKSQVYSEAFEGTHGQDLDVYDSNWTVTTSTDLTAKIDNTQKNGGSTSVRFSEPIVIPGGGEIQAYRQVDEFDELIMYVRGSTIFNQLTPFRITSYITAANRCGRISFGKSNSTDPNSLYYFDRLTETDSGLNFAEDTWYKIRIVHDVLRGLYSAFVTGGAFSTETTICENVEYYDGNTGSPKFIDIHKSDANAPDESEYWVDDIETNNHVLQSGFENLTDSSIDISSITTSEIFLRFKFWAVNGYDSPVLKKITVTYLQVGENPLAWDGATTPTIAVTANSYNDDITAPIDTKTGYAITFQASDGEPTGFYPTITIEEYWFDFGDGLNSGWITHNVVNHVYSKHSQNVSEAGADREWNVRVKVKYSNDEVSPWSSYLDINVANAAPDARLWVRPIVSRMGSSGLSEYIYFFGSDSFDIDGNGSIKASGGYLFDYGDGTAQSWQDDSYATHQYSGAGTYVVGLTVKDDLDLSSSKLTTKIIIKPALTSVLIVFHRRPRQIDFAYSADYQITKTIAGGFPDVEPTTAKNRTVKISGNARLGETDITLLVNYVENQTLVKLQYIDLTDTVRVFTGYIRNFNFSRRGGFKRDVQYSADLQYVDGIDTDDSDLILTTYLRYIRSGSLPTPSSAYRDVYLHLVGGAGVRDRIYFCSKGEDGNYSWVEIGAGEVI
jgi:hypothetical protein